MLGVCYNRAMTEDNKHPNWGGKREGAGGPRIEDEIQEPRTINLTALRWDHVLRLGDGNYSLGVRKLLDFYEEMNRRSE